MNALCAACSDPSRGGLETKSKDSSDCASVHKKFFGKRFKRVPKAKGPGGSLPVKTLTSEGYLKQ